MISVQARQLAAGFAAELRGVDLRLPLEQARLDSIYDAFLKYGVVIVPGQALTIDQQLAFARTFGDLHVLPNSGMQKRRIGDGAIDDVSNLSVDGDLAGANSEKVMFALGNQLWHSDLSFCATPAHASMLHALEIAQDDGQTEFCDLAAAYDALPDATKARLDGRVAMHSLAHSRIRGGHANFDVAALLKIRPPAYQPLVRIHPETGQKILFVGAHVAGIEGMEDAEAQQLIDELIAHASQPQFVYQHRWAVHDLVIWDNRRVLHRGRPYDVDGVRRVMHRATIEGDGPNVIDGVIQLPVVQRRPVRVAAA